MASRAAHSDSSQQADLLGFALFYPLLRALVATQDESTFYQRLRILLALAQWSGSPPTVMDVARKIGEPEEEIRSALAVLRRAGWLISSEDIFYYVLSPHGRILIMLLQMLAQPWQEGDMTAFAAQLYEAADGLNIGQDLLRAQFEMVLSTLEDRVRQTERALDAEDTELVRTRLKESHRDVKIAQKALQLRQQGAVAQDDHQQTRRMHQAISKLGITSAQLNIRYQRLLARDLLAQGGITFGDILAWARDANVDDLAEALLPYWQPSYSVPWFVPESQIVDGMLEMDGRPPTPPPEVPDPTPLADLPPTAHIDELKQQLYRKQEKLRAELKEQDPLPLPQWIESDSWAEAVSHFAAAFDPDLADATRVEIPIYLTLDPEGNVTSRESKAVAFISEGQLSLKDRS